MKNIFSNYFKMSILASVIFFIFGLLLFFDPESIIVSISVVIGIIGIIFGVFEIMLYTKTNSHTSLVSGLFSLIAGLVLILNTNILATIIPMIIGIAMLFQGIKKLEIAVSFKEQNISNWSYMLVASILSILCGILFVVNPILGAVVTTQIIGIIIMIYAVMSIIDNIAFKDKFDRITKVIDE